MPQHIHYVFVASIVDKIHTVDIVYWLKSKYMRVKPSKSTKTNPYFFFKGGGAPSSPVLDPPLGTCGSNWTSDKWLWRQMSYYIFVSVEISCIQASFWVENQDDDFAKIIQDSTRVFIYLGTTTVIGSSRIALWEIHSNFCLTTMQFIRFFSIRIRVIVRACCARYR